MLVIPSEVKRRAGIRPQIIVAQSAPKTPHYTVDGKRADKGWNARSNRATRSLSDIFTVRNTTGLRPAENLNGTNHHHCTQRTSDSALRKSGKKNRRSMRRSKTRARAWLRSVLGAYDGGSPTFSPYLRCARFPPSCTAEPASALCSCCGRRSRMVLAPLLSPKGGKRSPRSLPKQRLILTSVLRTSSGGQNNNCHFEQRATKAGINRGSFPHARSQYKTSG